MIKKNLKIKGAYLLSLTKKVDNRGFFARIYCKESLKKKKIGEKIKQINVSQTFKKGCIRGLHYQKGKFAESKRIIVLEGSIFDVLIDLRKKSQTYLKKISIKLSSKKLQMLVVPRGVAHGYQSLTKFSSILYINDNNYSKKHEGGIRYNDKNFKINWPIKKIVASKKDLQYKHFNNLT